MKQFITRLALVALLALSFSFTSCTENKSEGDRVGYVTTFSKAGIVWKSYEGHLNQSQTGNNTANTWEFSLDNDKNQDSSIARLNRALNEGKKVKLSYHLVFGYNVLHNRGATDYMVHTVQIVDEGIPGYPLNHSELK